MEKSRLIDKNNKHWETAGAGLDMDMEEIWRQEDAGLNNHSFRLETWPEKISKKLPIRQHLVLWAIIPELIFLAQYILIRIYSYQADGFYTLAIYLGILSYLILLIPYTSNKLSSLLTAMPMFIDGDRVEVENWYKSQAR